MRVAYICLDPGVPVFGCKGSSVHCQEVIRAMRQKGCDVEVFAFRLGEEVPDDLSDMTCHRMGGKLPRDPAAREQTLIELNREVRESLRSQGPFDLVYERYSLWSSAGMAHAADEQVPGILEVNAPLIEEQETYRTLVDRVAAENIRSSCFKNATSIVAVSDEVAQKVRGIYFAREKTTTVANGVDCGRFKPTVSRNQRMNRAADEVVVGFVGTLKPWHGVETLLKAFSVVHSLGKQVRLKIVGDGPERENLQRLANEFPNDVASSIDWLGSVPNAKVPEILAGFDVAVAPYPELEDFYFSPLKILEYMAAGLPVVASNLGQIPKLLEDNATGVLISPGSDVELASALLKLVSDSELRMRLGQAAQTCAETEHTWTRVVDRILATVSSHLLHCEMT